MLVIELVSNWDIYWVLCSLVMFDLIDDSTRPEIMLCDF